MSQTTEETIINKNNHSGRWTKLEHLKFLEGLELFGRNWKKIQTVVKSRTGSQIRSHAQKYFNKIGDKAIGSDKAPDAFSESNLQDYNQYLGKGPSLLNFSTNSRGNNDQFLLQSSHPDETSISSGPILRLIEENRSKDSALFLDILKNSKQEGCNFFLKTYVDMQGTRQNMQTEHKLSYRNKTSFVKVGNAHKEVSAMVEQSFSEA